MPKALIYRNLMAFPLHFTAVLFFITFKNEILIDPTER